MSASPDRREPHDVYHFLARQSRRLDESDKLTADKLREDPVRSRRATKVARVSRPVAGN
jgi:hypothetical protein